VTHALSKLHGLLERLSPALKLSLPSYMQELNFVRSLLVDQAALPSLASADREMLSSTFDRLQDRLDQLVPVSTWRVIHGSPHQYNMLVVSDEPAFIDFETTCVGPREWDLAHLNADVDQQFARSMQAEVLSLCRQMTSVKTATLCAADIDRGDMREHAEYHLARIREDVAKTMG
jgi:Ser/Thr protein kinase RdoA (MazF antagonist)